MAITLDGITLPDDLVWSDEHNWSPVRQSIDKSLNGALIVQESAQLKGKFITLVGDQTVWVTKATLELLEVKANTPNLTMSLDYWGTVVNVIFLRSGDKSPIQSKQIVELANPDNDHIYSIVIKLMEV